MFSGMGLPQMLRHVALAREGVEGVAVESVGLGPTLEIYQTLEVLGLDILLLVH